MSTHETHNDLPTTAYINAGGRGSRLHKIVPPDPEYGVPKALIEVGGARRIKLLDHQIAWLGGLGIQRIIVGAGDQTDVAAYAKNVYSGRSDVSVATSSEMLGTGGDLLRSLGEHPQLFEESALVTNVDTVLELEVDKLAQVHAASGNDMTIALTHIPGVPNYNQYFLDANGKVIYCGEVENGIETEPNALDNTVLRASSMGAVMIKTDFLRSVDWTAEDGPLSVYSDLVGLSLNRGTLGGFDSGNAFMLDVGTEPSYGKARATENNILDPYLCYYDLS